MKLEIETSAKAIEVANMILGKGISEIEKDKYLQAAFQLSDTDLKNAKTFKKALLKSFTNPKFSRCMISSASVTCLTGSNSSFIVL